MDLIDYIKYIPNKPGIYFFKDNSNKILYIGKSKQLRTRVKSYFSETANTKSKAIIMNSSKIDYLVSDSEIEALITEANMIKEYRPKYNIVLKDDKSFPYIIIRNEDYPRVEIIRKKNLQKEGHLYFGPYTDARYLRKLIKILHQNLPLKSCDSLVDEDFIANNRRFKGKTCFCGFCMSDKIISRKKYAKIINSVVDFLKGKNKTILFQLKNLMKSASEDLRYEEAAKFRDSINSIKSFIGKQKKITKDFNDYDIAHIAIRKNYGVGLVMKIRSGLFIRREKFEFSSKNDLFETSLNAFLVQYYNSTEDIPNELIINSEFDDMNNFNEWLNSKRKKKVVITNPKLGIKKRMLNLCIKNTNLAINDIILRNIKREDSPSKILKELKKAIGMEKLPKRIEAFDNSNFQGLNPVAGMVCFIDGKPAKSEYRKYNIKTVSGIDDFKSMEEVVYRRYFRLKRENKDLPNLILIDGGKGQLSSAKKSLNKLGLSHIHVVGLAKKLEEVFIPESSMPQNISKSSPALYLLRKIRDEVHRYSITFHKQKRNSDIFKSRLKEIKGIGDKRYLKLLSIYKTINNLKKANAEEISIKIGISRSLSEDILRKLNAK